MADIRRVEPDGELGMRVAASGAALAVAVGICYHEHARIYHLLVSALPQQHRHLYTFLPGEASFDVLMIAVLGGLLLSLPVLSYELCAYASSEFRPEVLVVPGLCMAGIIFGWAVVVPLALRYLVDYNSEVVTYLPRASDYIQFTMLTLLGSGVAFGLPAAWALRESS